MAVQEAPNPYFDISFWRTLGVIEKVTRDGETLPAGAVLMKQFLMKLARVMPLPVVPALSLLRTSLFYLSLIWVLANLLSVLSWLIYPEGLKQSISSPARLK
jgi:hypothetical protein